MPEHAYDSLLKCREATSRAVVDLVNAEVDFLTSQGWKTHWDHTTDTISWVDPATKTQNSRAMALEYAENDFKREKVVGPSNTEAG